MVKIPNIYLVSNSPRRRAMFKFFDISFEPLSLEFDESYKSSKPEDVCMEICNKKIDSALCFLGESKVKSSVVVVADTLVFLENKILGKPKNRDDAFDMLQKLSGREHTVISAVGYSIMGKKKTLLEKTVVKFIDLSSSMIENYLDKEHYMDKAGSYAIQSEENFFVESISGSYLNVVGFPMQQFLGDIKKCLK